MLLLAVVCCAARAVVEVTSVFLPTANATAIAGAVASAVSRGFASVDHDGGHHLSFTAPDGAAAAAWAAANAGVVRRIEPTAHFSATPLGAPPPPGEDPTWYLGAIGLNASALASMASGGANATTTVFLLDTGVAGAPADFCALPSSAACAAPAVPSSHGSYMAWLLLSVSPGAVLRSVVALNASGVTNTYAAVKALTYVTAQLPLPGPVVVRTGWQFVGPRYEQADGPSCEQLTAAPGAPGLEWATLRRAQLGGGGPHIPRCRSSGGRGQRQL